MDVRLGHPAVASRGPTMIRLTFTTDPAGVIGASSPEEQTARLPHLPPALGEVLRGLYASPHVALGVRELDRVLGIGLAEGTVFLITTNPTYVPPADLPDAAVVSSVDALAARFRGPNTELNVLGGRAIFRLFLRHADQLLIAETAELVPGDIVFRDWDDDTFELVSETAWEGGRTLEYRRAACKPALARSRASR